MKISFRTARLHKRFPLVISRGVSGDSDNLFVEINDNGARGQGEMAPGAMQGAATAAAGQAALTQFIARENKLARDDKSPAGAQPGIAIAQVYARARESAVPPCALAALDVALWDRLARIAGLPLYRLRGFARARAPTSVTLGISPPEIVRERIPQLLAAGARAIKVKLGSPDGADVDREMFAQVMESLRGRAIPVRVDANGGWDVAQSRAMMKWLAARGADYVEQPLARGRENDLPAVGRNRPLPVFVDESCCFAADIPNWAHAVDGVNIKLMKCGGITGALHIIAVARAFNLKTMLGCMSETSMAIAAAAALAGEVDYVDLDSHLNLEPDPCTGAQFINGVVTPSETPGHGATLRA